jgi:NADH:ubiquinone oxidoreductase subunit 6 (subunit J)
VAVFVGVAGTILRARPLSGRGPALTTAALGEAVLTEWVLAFEVLGILLVAALLGALYLARTEE